MTAELFSCGDNRELPDMLTTAIEHLRLLISVIITVRLAIRQTPTPIDKLTPAAP